MSSAATTSTKTEETRIDYEEVARDLFSGLLDATWELDALYSTVTMQCSDTHPSNPLFAWLNLVDRHLTEARHSATRKLHEHAGALNRQVPWDDEEADDE